MAQTNEAGQESDLAGNRISVRLPKNLDLGRVMPKSLEFRHDDARWLIYTILRKVAHEDVDADGYARLHSEVLERVLPERTRSAVTKSLITNGVLETAGHSRGLKSRGYRLTETYRSQPVLKVWLSDTRLIARILHERVRMEAEQRKRWLPVDYRLDQIQRERLTVVPEAETILASLAAEVRWPQKRRVERIREREPRYSVGIRVRQRARRRLQHGFLRRFGSVQFMNYTIDPAVHAALGNRQDNKVIDGGKY
jgi:hypothetical protein